MKANTHTKLRVGEKLGTYRIEGVLGAGGMGRVYLARDTTLKRSVAIKLVDPGRQSHDDLVWEARLAASLDHPSICTVFGVGYAGDEPFIIMEYLRGVPLSMVIRQQRTLPLETALSVQRQIAGAVAYAHDCGIVHGDIKCSNIMVGDDGRVKVLDFGLAVRRPREDAEADTTCPSPSTGAAGTVPYMAPERIRGRQPDVLSDIWALGVVLYEMLAGCRPFRGVTPLELAAHILFNQRAPMAPIPEAVSAVIERCLAVSPNDRYGSVVELSAALEALLPPGEDGGSWKTDPPGSSNPPRQLPQPLSAGDR